MIIVECEQRSPEWFSERAGNPGASSFDKIVTTKGERSKQREAYMYQLAAEAITGQVEESYVSTAMQVGIEREDEARALYEMIHGVEVKKVGLIYPDEQKKYHCSPDGTIETIRGGLEMKNPLAKTHIEYLLKNVLPTEYKLQVQGSLLITGFEFWDFFSYYPGLPPFIVRVKRDEKLIEKLKAELDAFAADLAMLVRKLKEM